MNDFKLVMNKMEMIICHYNYHTHVSNYYWNNENK